MVSKEQEFPEFPIKGAIGIILTGILAITLLITLFGSIYIVDAGERAVLLTWGEVDPQPRSEGLHFKIPIMQTKKIFDVRTQKYVTSASSASKDLQIVSTEIAVNYHLQPESVPSVYQTVGAGFEDKLLQPAVQEVLKASTARFTAEELITKREDVKTDIQQRLSERLLSRHVIIEQISITNFDFSAEFNRAIEGKVTAEQNALAAKNKLEQVKYEAEQRIAQATAEAEAIKIQASAIQVQGGNDYVRLQAISKWDGVLPRITGGVVPFVNVDENEGVSS